MQAVVPVFGTVALGYGLARAGVLAQSVGHGLARYTFLVAIPALLFERIASAALPASVPWRFLLAFYLPVLGIYFVAGALTRRRHGWSARDASLAGMSAAYANIALLGLPLLTAAAPAEALVPLFVLLGTQSLVLFPVATWQLERGRVGPQGRGWRRLAGLAANPILVSLALGLVANRAGWAPDPTVARALDLLAAGGPGCALVALGVTLARYPLRGHATLLPWLLGLKNLACPALVWCAGAAAGLAPPWHAVAVLLAAMPTGVNAFVFANRYGLREDEVAKAVIWSTVVSLPVVTWLLAVLPGLR